MLDLLKEITHTHTTTIIHSTIQKYNHQRNGVHEVDLYQEIKRRHPALLILIARPKFKDKNTSILIKKAQQLLKQEIKYSTSDALCSIFSL